MIIELWTLKLSGPNKSSFTYWKSINGDHVPVEGRTFIYRTSTGNETKFTVSHIEYLAKYGSLKIQVCLTRLKESKK